jgi:hypothetical protein
MNQKEFIERVKHDRDVMDKILKQAETLKQGGVYEYDSIYYNWASRRDGKIKQLAVLRGFSFGAMSCGARLEILAQEAGAVRGKSVTVQLPLKSHRWIKQSEVPLYVGYEYKAKAFETLVKGRMRSAVFAPEKA